MPYTYTLSAIIPASPLEVYEAWLDSLGHSEMTGSEAIMSDEVGADVSAWQGYISGRNLELVPGERIVQSWRTSEFGDTEEDSVITVTFEEAENGTLLTLVHSNVPHDQRNYEEGGWQSNYFEPMVAYFSRRVEEVQPVVADQYSTRREKSPKRAARSSLRTGRKKRAASRKSKSAPQRKKTAPAKSKNKPKKKLRRPAQRRGPAKPARSKRRPGKRR